MFPGPGSVIDGLVNDMKLETLPIRGSLLGIAYQGSIVRGKRAESYPLRLPMSLAGRLSFIRAGLKMRAAAKKYNALARPKPGETAVSKVRATRGRREAAAGASMQPRQNPWSQSPRTPISRPRR